MSTYTVRPSSVIENGGGTNSDANALTYLGDNSDATTINNTGTKSVSWVFGLGAPVITAGEFVARVGMSLRWKGNSSGNYSIGGQIYRATDTKPAGVASLTPNNSAVFTSTQVGYMSVPWTTSEVSSLRYLWFDGRSNSGWAQTDHADIWGSIYTIAPATATPSARTETTSVYPTITVSASATIDWEATTFDWQNLRKVTVEVRIESGGTGAGTGTLVSLGSASVNFTATGSQNVTVAMPDALPNGTYKIYARALRYREDGIARSDQYGSWSTAATLTMSTPLPNTPTVTVSADQNQDRIAVTITPVATTGYTSPYIYLQRSDDAGITWVSVRGASGIAGAFGSAATFYDYEAPREQSVYYRAYVKASYSGFVNQSANSNSQSALLVADGWNLKNPTDPTKNVIDVNVVGNPEEDLGEELGVFRPLGRRLAVVVAGSLTGWDGSLELVLASANDWAALKALAESQTVLRLESAFGWSKYVRLVNGAKATNGGTKGTPVRRVNLAYVEVDKPTITVGDTVVDLFIPTLIDGGTATSTFDNFYDGGTAISTQTATFDGGASV